METASDLKGFADAEEMKALLTSLVGKHITIVFIKLLG